MTRPYSSYDYDPQSVRSKSGECRFHFAPKDEWSLVLSRGESVLWKQKRTPVSPKQLFVDDSGMSVVLDAADVLTLRDAQGETRGQQSLLDLVAQGACPPPGAILFEPTEDCPLTLSTAGLHWDDYLAGGFLHLADGPVFCISGRGKAPLVFELATLSPVTIDAEELEHTLRALAPEVLAEALAALEEESPENRPISPWRMAAVGWARTAAETKAHAAASALRRLAELEMVVSGMTYQWSRRRPRDEIRIDRHAIDPLRQATHLALARLGQETPDKAIYQLSRRRALLRREWVELARPHDYRERLTEIELGALPSHVCTEVGPPTHIDETAGRIVWSYDYRDSTGARSLELVWGKRGVEKIRTLDEIPPSAPGDGRLA